MILVPDSLSLAELREFNPCHDPEDGKFCSGDGAPRVDEHGITHVGDYIELYHGTSARRAAKIAKDGLKIRAVRQQTMQGDPESSRNYVWFAKKRGSAQGYSEMHTNPVVVTVRVPEGWLKKLDPYRRNSGPDSVWINQAIPAKYVHSVDRVKR
jgi:RNA:NAD 2'-phosphotransferase (TPT1/KptA family)